MLYRRNFSSSEPATTWLRAFLFLLAAACLTPATRGQTPDDTPPAATDPTATPAADSGAPAGPVVPLDPSSPSLPPLITLFPPGAPPAVPRPSLPPASVTQLDGEYNSAISTAVPEASHKGRPVSLLEAVRATLIQNTQIQLSGQDIKLARAFLQQNTGVFDSHILLSGSKAHNDNERTPAAIRMDLQNRETKKVLAAQFLDASARLQADLDHSMATNTLPQQDFTTGGSTSFSSSNGVLSSGTVAFLDQATQNLANAQKQTGDAFNTLITQISTQNATPAQMAQLKVLQQQNINEQQQTEKQFITAFQKIGSDLRKSVATLPLSSQTSNSTTYSAGVTKLFRNGVTIEPLLSFSQQGDGTGLPNNQARLGVMVNVPLLRNYGEDAVQAPERAASIDYESSQLTLRHAIAQNVYQTALIYWNVVAAQRRVDLLRQSNRVASTLLSLSRQLVKADELAPADVYVISARTNDTALQVYSAELALLDAQQQLAVQMGDAPESLTVPLLPSDDFLPAQPSGPFVSMSPDPLVQTANTQRADLMAARKLVASGKVLARAAALNLKPRLDFTLNASFSAINDGSHFNKYFSAFTTSYTGPSVLGSFVFDWPVANNTQRGLLNQARATLAQRMINIDDLRRAITSGVVFSLGSVGNALLQLEDSQAGRLNYRQSLDAQYAKLKAGNSTFLDAVETEQLYTTAGLDIISAQLQFATSLARVRYETGTILPPTPDASTIGWRELTTVPSPWPENSAPVRPAQLKNIVPVKNTAPVKSAAR